MEQNQQQRNHYMIQRQQQRQIDISNNNPNRVQNFPHQQRMIAAQLHHQTQNSHQAHSQQFQHFKFNIYRLCWQCCQQIRPSHDCWMSNFSPCWHVEMMSFCQCWNVEMLTFPQCWNVEMLSFRHAFHCDPSGTLRPLGPYPLSRMALGPHAPVPL